MRLNGEFVAKEDILAAVQAEAGGEAMVTAAQVNAEAQYEADKMFYEEYAPQVEEAIGKPPKDATAEEVGRALQKLLPVTTTETAESDDAVIAAAEETDGLAETGEGDLPTETALPPTLPPTPSPTAEAESAPPARKENPGRAGLEKAGREPSVKLYDALRERAFSAEGKKRFNKRAEMREIMGVPDTILETDFDNYVEAAVNALLLDVGIAREQSYLRADAIAEMIPAQDKDNTKLLTQAFSTPPGMAALAARAAQLRLDDSVLEPSAGNGGIAVFLGPERTDVNEWSQITHTGGPRGENLVALGFRDVTDEDATTLDRKGQYDVVVLNPPFSAGASGVQDMSETDKHALAALRSVKDGGRVVVISYETWGPGSAKHRKFFERIENEFGAHIVAQIRMEGKLYRRQGAAAPTAMTVIDTGFLFETPPAVVRPDGYAGTLDEVAAWVAQIPPRRDAKTTAERENAETSPPPPPADGSDSASETDSTTTGETARTEADRRADPKFAPGASVEKRTAVDRLEQLPPAAAADTPTPHERRRTVAARLAGPAHPGGLETTAALATQDRPPLEKWAVEIVNQVAALVPADSKKKPSARQLEEAAMALMSFERSVRQRPMTYSEILSAGRDTEGGGARAAVAGADILGTQADDFNNFRGGHMAGWATGTGKSTIAALVALAGEKLGWPGTIFVTKKNDSNLLGQMITEFGRYGKGAESLRQFSGKTDDKDENLDSPDAKSENPMLNGQIMMASYGQLGRVDASGAGHSYPAEPDGTQFHSLNLRRLDATLGGRNWDGLIIFDESHAMRGLIPKVAGGMMARQGPGPSARAVAGAAIQARYPKARVLYLSGTALTNEKAIFYAPRVMPVGEGEYFSSLTQLSDAIGGDRAMMEFVSKR